mmetsp:Transcript_103191/g.300949  ORF Transcript_103191/g.300949 Transcript_103191/m.300949 type:complete len:312 (+) Transcript_103191:468-1403(+)
MQAARGHLSPQSRRAQDAPGRREARRLCLLRAPQQPGVLVAELHPGLVYPAEVVALRDVRVHIQGEHRATDLTRPAQAGQRPLVALIPTDRCCLRLQHHQHVALGLHPGGLGQGRLGLPHVALAAKLLRLLGLALRLLGEEHHPARALADLRAEGLPLRRRGPLVLLGRVLGLRALHLDVRVPLLQHGLHAAQAAALVLVQPEVRLAPALARTEVALLDRLEMLPRAAANALLGAFEEIEDAEVADEKPLAGRPVLVALPCLLGAGVAVAAAAVAALCGGHLVHQVGQGLALRLHLGCLTSGPPVVANEGR